MDRRERMNSIQIAVQAALGGARADIWTALPGIVESFDAAKRTASVQPAIQGQVQDKTTGNFSNVNLPLIPDVPVAFIGAGDFLLTVPVVQGTEGLLIFCSRCIDAFWQQGGVQPQAEVRMHDLSDAMFIPFPISQVQEIEAINADGMELRNKARTIYLGIDALGLYAKGNLRLDGNLQISGAIQALAGTIYTGAIETSGALKAGGDVVANNGTPQVVHLTTHIHPQSGGGNTSPPTAGS